MAKKQTNGNTAHSAPEAHHDDEVISEALDLAAETLQGDIRDWLLGHMRMMQKPWPKLSEREQTDAIHAANAAASSLVRKAVRIAAGHGFERIEVTVGKFGVKEGEITAQFVCAATDQNILKVVHAGQSVLVLADPSMFDGERAPARADKDQPELDIDADADDVDDTDPVGADSDRAAHA